MDQHVVCWELSSSNLANAYAMLALLGMKRWELISSLGNALTVRVFSEHAFTEPQRLVMSTLGQVMD